MSQKPISKLADNKQGNLVIFPTIESGKFPTVRIVGDPQGLKYLADLLNELADLDQEENGDPIGTREHTILSPETHLNYHSCKVELCRMDAKGTGELIDEYTE
jgi:hypothetical protein